MSEKTLNSESFLLHDSENNVVPLLKGFELFGFEFFLFSKALITCFLNFKSLDFGLAFALEGGRGTLTGLDSTKDELIV